MDAYSDKMMLMQIKQENPRLIADEGKNIERLAPILAAIRIREADRRHNQTIPESKEA